MKFRKKPVVIEAIQWTGKNATEINEFCPQSRMSSGIDNLLQIETLEGVMTANEGDWIIKGVKGEYYPCKPDIFKATYDRV